LPLVRVVGALLRDGPKVLLAKRGPGGSYPFHWEFPGGKVEPGEDDRSALARELMEELDIEAAIEAHFVGVQHDYPRFRIDFHVYECRILAGELRCLEHEELRWVEVNDMVDLDFPPADIPAVEKLKTAPLE
jgi:8-oxo-dGTP diphosphatase